MTRRFFLSLFAALAALPVFGSRLSQSARTQVVAVDYAFDIGDGSAFAEMSTDANGEVRASQVFFLYLHRCADCGVERRCRYDGEDSHPPANAVMLCVACFEKFSVKVHRSRLAGAWSDNFSDKTLRDFGYIGPEITLDGRPVRWFR